MRGQSILIVDYAISAFVHELQRRLENEGAETMVARTPAIARQRLDQFDFVAALVGWSGENADTLNKMIADFKEQGIEVIRYGEVNGPRVEARDTDHLVAVLRQRLRCL